MEFHYKVSSDGVGDPIKLETVASDKDSLTPNWGAKP
jgi:hypothetical protein